MAVIKFHSTFCLLLYGIFLDVVLLYRNIVFTVYGPTHISSIGLSSLNAPRRHIRSVVGQACDLRYWDMEDVALGLLQLLLFRMWRYDNEKKKSLASQFWQRSAHTEIGLFVALGTVEKKGENKLYFVRLVIHFDRSVSRELSTDAKEEYGKRKAIYFF